MIKMISLYVFAINLIKEVPAYSESKYAFIKWIVGSEEVVSSITAIHVRNHYEETSVLQLEVCVCIKNRITTYFCLAFGVFLNTK